MPASVLHILLRNLCQLTLLITFASSGRLSRSLIAVQCLLLLITSICASIGYSWLTEYYKLEYLFFPILSGLLYFDLSQGPTKSRSDYTVRALLAAWTLVQLIDFACMITGYGAYTAPVFIAAIVTNILFLQRIQTHRLGKIEWTTAEILRAIQSNRPAKEILPLVAAIARESSRFARVSAYIDAAHLGGRTLPGATFLRVLEQGYSKDTSRDWIINFGEDRGQVMRAATLTGKSVFSLGGDGSWFCVVPVGPHSCINLSDGAPRARILALESREIIDRVSPALQALGSRLSDEAIQRGVALLELRRIRGDGTWNEQIGCISADIGNYTKLVEQYGNAFSSFVAQRYLPALINAAAENAKCDRVFGDEAFLIVTQDLIPPTMRLSTAVLRSLEQLDEFIRSEGAALCKADGYPPLVVSIGASIGVATIEIDASGVRVSGRAVSSAKRLRECAGIERRALASELPIDLETSLFRQTQEVPLVEHGHLLWAKKLQRRR